MAAKQPKGDFVKNVILIKALLLANLSWATSETNLENAPEIKARLQELSQEGWEKSGPSTTVSIHSFYYTNSAQGETLLLVVPIYGRKYLMSSCIAATFSRGGSSAYHFKKFTQIDGYCQ